MTRWSLFSAAVAVLGLTLAAHAAPAGKSKTVPYLLTTCPVSGEAIDPAAEAVSLVHEGREIRFCCDKCPAEFEKDPAAYLSKVDEQIRTQQRATYPMRTCLVSDEELGSMGEPHEIVHEGRLVRFCCEGCVDMFKADAATYLKKLDQAVIDAQVESYPLKTCVISGEELGSMGEPTDIVVANRLVRFCCEGCIGDFHRNPREHLAKIDAAVKAAAPAAEAPAPAAE